MRRTRGPSVHPDCPGGTAFCEATLLHPLRFQYFLHPLEFLHLV